MTKTTDALPALTDAAARQLASLVLQAARQAAPSDRFMGSRKVFIAPLHSRMPALGYAADLDVFKTRLAELCRRGLISLCRFDLPAEVHGTAVVFASEAPYGGDVVHCVEDGSHPQAHVRR